eukprot:TRINITY_DN4450_c0_g1_i3.p1 TRINITY_DN4450_c0_g1~~TRINITY_DN4450_c0_g1_i3.p1  ORF type:complete len:764 (+),score=132.99 TRINITY_DN4450_c0_g1_i3:590-2881(+)
MNSPDVVPMFVSGPHVHGECYPAELEDFSADGSHLDKWVFDRVQAFLLQAQQNETARLQLMRSGNIFFLHLLGLDTNGHAFRPNGAPYLNSISMVDRNIEHIHKLFETVFDDHATAYLFTSDHGMSNRGSHGDGDPDNTRTPVVAWGAGVQPPEPCAAVTNAHTDRMVFNTEQRVATLSAGSHDVLIDASPVDWALSDVCRKDIAQADLAPLMATLAGVPLPVNSVGALPVSYLAGDAEYRSNALFANTKQILAQYRLKMEWKRSAVLLFRPYPKLPDLLSVNAATAEIAQFIAQQQFDRAENACQELIVTCIQGLRFYQTYDWMFLMSVVTLGYAGFMVFVLVSLLPQTSTSAVFKAKVDMAVQIVSVCFVLMLVLEYAPLQYYVYVAFPIYFWWQAVRRFGDVSWRRVLTVRNIFMLIITVLLLETMVISWFRREILFICAMAVALWPIVIGSRWSLALLWFISCTLVGSFTLLPIDAVHLSHLIYPGGLVAFALAVAAAIRTRKQRLSAALLIAQACLLLLSVGIVWNTTNELASGTGLPLLHQIASWCILCVSWVLPYLSSRDATCRFESVFIGLAAPYMLLSTTYEMLFLCAFGCVLWLWPHVEKSAQQLRLSESHTAFVFMFLTNMSLFGPGNIASISSFDMFSTYRFVTVFSPFLMGTLLIVKVAIPFVLVSCAFAITNQTMQRQPANVLLRSTVLSEVPALTFFFLVRDEGSWRDIGMSISHFAIQNGQIVIGLLLYGLSAVYCRGLVYQKKRLE